MATILLPSYFEALNCDFQYQLTPLGTLALVTVVQEIKHNKFTIKSSKPAVRVSWQVTGIRHDAFAEAYRTPVEEEKPPQERGSYLYPQLFKAQPTLSVKSTPK
jgi:trimeric autotransporter adhesin